MPQRSDESSFSKDSAHLKLLFEASVVIGGEFLTTGSEVLQNLHPGEGLDPEDLIKKKKHRTSTRTPNLLLVS